MVNSLGIINSLYFRSDPEQAFSTVLGTIIKYDKKNLVLKELLKLSCRKNKRIESVASDVLAKVDKSEVTVSTEKDINNGLDSNVKGYIDVCIEIKHPTDKVSAYLLIENKIKASKFHGRQLKNYMQYVEEECGSNNTIFLVLSEIDFYELVRNTELENLKYDSSNEKDKVKIAQALIEKRNIVPLQWSDVDVLLESVSDKFKGDSSGSIYFDIIDDFRADIRRRLQMNFTGFKSLNNYNVANFFEFANNLYSLCDEINTQADGTNLRSWKGNINQITYSDDRTINEEYKEYKLGKLDGAWEYGFHFSFKNDRTKRVYIGVTWLEKGNEQEPIASFCISTDKGSIGLLDGGKTYCSLNDFVTKFSENNYKNEIKKAVDRINQN